MRQDWEDEAEAYGFEGSYAGGETEAEGAVEGPEEGAEEGAPGRKRRRRRRKVASPEHEARIERYRGLVEERGWIFAPPSPPQPLSWLFSELTQQQIESLSA